MKYTTGIIYKLINKEDKNNISYLALIEYDLTICKNIDSAKLFFSDIEFCDIISSREIYVSDHTKKILNECNIQGLEVQRVQITEIVKTNENIRYEIKEE